MLKSKKKKLVTFLLTLSMVLGTSPQIYALTNEKDDKLSNTSSNNYPIVMVHGFIGWGNNELFGVNYWGGFSSLKDHLNNEGYKVLTPTIGPISSNWDRACELYAYLKGGAVDYGEAHSKKYGHNRYGKIYPGAYKDIGGKSNDGTINKVHLIGHSMGGQTARVMTQLLEKGNIEEINSTPQSNISPLFQGGKSWVSSITTLSTPHDGSPTAREQTKILSDIEQFIAGLKSEFDTIDSNNNSFDYMLDHWGIRQNKNESFKNYTKRITSNDLLKRVKDFGGWELTPEGSRDLNSCNPALEDVYYFSLACQDTHKDPLTNNQVPNIGMKPRLMKSSKAIGSYISNEPGEVPITSDWWPNDGVVSVISAKGPQAGSNDNIVPFNGTAQIGVWNYLGIRQSTDHLDIIGRYVCDKNLKDEYSNIAKMLTSLPK